MYIVFDIGGTNSRFGIVNSRKELTKDIIFPTNNIFSAGLQDIKRAMSKLLPNRTISIVCGGIAGTLDQHKRKLIRSPHLPGWVNQPVKEALQDIFNSQVYIDNDAIMDGLGEAIYGAGKSYSNIAYITISTGVGGSKIVNKIVDAQSSGFEPGHHIIDVNGELCDSCQVKGHLESYISGSAIRKKYHQDPKTITDVHIWDDLSRYLAIGLANTIVFWSPEIIILGGSVSKHIPLEMVEKHLKEYITIFPSIPQVIKSQLGSLNGLYGALSFITQKNFI